MKAILLNELPQELHARFKESCKVERITQRDALICFMQAMIVSSESVIKTVKREAKKLDKEVVQKKTA